MSWLAPLVNNRVGDCLNLELRHEQLFFIRDDRVLDDIGYSEQGRRFSEADFGKPIHSLEDLKRNGYWLVGREYDPAIMREALARQKDGYYYSLLSNQCQDWVDRLRRSAERLERERGLDTGQASRSAISASHYSKPVSPTEPASIWMGLLALALGIGAVLGPIIAGDLFTVFIGVVFLLSGASHIAYGFRRLHSSDTLPFCVSAWYGEPDEDSPSACMLGRRRIFACNSARRRFPKWSESRIAGAPAALRQRGCEALCGQWKAESESLSDPVVARSTRHSDTRIHLGCYVPLCVEAIRGSLSLSTLGHLYHAR
jgi:hypothetical protein